jgi:hypothetical protein
MSLRHRAEPQRPRLRKFDGTFRWFEDYADPHHTLSPRQRAAMGIVSVLLFVGVPVLFVRESLHLLELIARGLGIL